MLGFITCKGKAKLNGFLHATGLMAGLTDWDMDGKPNCPKCQERAEALLSSSDVLLTFNTETVRSPSDSVWDPVRQKIEEDPRREARRSGRMTGGLFLAAAMLLIAVLPDLIATPPTPSIHGHGVEAFTPKGIMSPDYSPYYPDPTWRELEVLNDGSARVESKGRNASYGY